jgi:hypothetical protein
MCPAALKELPVLAESPVLARARLPTPSGIG